MIYSGLSLTYPPYTHYLFWIKGKTQTPQLRPTRFFYMYYITPLYFFTYKISGMEHNWDTRQQSTEWHGEQCLSCYRRFKRLRRATPYCDNCHAAYMKVQQAHQATMTDQRCDFCKNCVPKCTKCHQAVRACRACLKQGKTQDQPHCSYCGVNTKFGGRL